MIVDWEPFGRQTYASHWAGNPSAKGTHFKSNGMPPRATLGLDWITQPPFLVPMSKRTPAVAIDKRRILHLLDDPYITSLTKLYVALGGRGSIPGSAAKRIREVLPYIGELLDANKTILALREEAEGPYPF